MEKYLIKNIKFIDFLKKIQKILQRSEKVELKIKNFN